MHIGFALFILGIIMIVLQSFIIAYVGQPPEKCADDDKRKLAVAFTSILLILGVIMLIAGGYALYQGKDASFSKSLNSFIC